MPRTILGPPGDGLRADGTLLGGWWHDAPEVGRIICDLCPRECSLKPGDRGFCFVRQNVDGAMVLSTYGRSTGFCIDPIEKKPLNHFYPGTSVLSFGTAGCNLGCKFCQNWDISKSREIERLSELAMPEAIAQAALQHGCKSVAFTYNDPVIWAEYAIDTAKACRAAGVRTVAVTAGYITRDARGHFYEFMDAANVDLKGFTEEFYHRITYSHLQPVLDTLHWLKHETDVWFEITNLVIPNCNDSMDEIRAMCGWILEHCGDEVPVHFTAFHPDFRMRDRPNTPHETLLAAYDVARQEGLKYVYTGNVNDVVHQSTYCAHCGKRVIERDWYALGEYRLARDRCAHCGGTVAGRFEDRPGNWGRKRVPVEISRFAQPPQVGKITTKSEFSEPPAPREGSNTQVVNISPKRESMTTATAPGTQAAPEPKLELSPDQQRLVRQAADEFVAADILRRSVHLPDPTLGGIADIPVMGAYVTLKRREQLRACCGFLGEPKRLIEALRHAAFRTATEDHRLPPISRTELPYLDLDVNILYGFQPVRVKGRHRVDAVEVGRHGLRVHRGESAGLLLPVVATENEWDSETFLRQVCRKAGLPTTAWQDDHTQLFTFESIAFGGPFDASVLGPDADLVPPRFSSDELLQLSAHAHQNVVALAEGLTPNYYLLGMPDGSVEGLMISVSGPTLPQPLYFSQLSLRPGLPLQATLFRLCELAAQAIRNRPQDLASLRIGLTLLFDPAMHGTANRPDLRGFNSKRRACFLLEQEKTACVFAPTLDAEQVANAVLGELHLLNPASAGLFGLEVQSTEKEIRFSSSARAVADSSPRRTAVAGRFYPSDPAELSGLVDGLLAASERQSQPWPAAMVPHAGLRFSGQLAAAVLNRLKIPDLVIVIGPKHTREGVDWAVSPHSSWSIPGATIPADTAVARQLVEAIPGLQPDASAHRNEHAIEVELPFLAKLAPSSRVVGVAIGGGTWERCQDFATGLAQVIKRLPSRPLLLISSDMNHFANDSENRRLDEIALQAMEQRDPVHLLTMVTDHNISMCGVLPAVIVMETLRQLGGLQTTERVGYATSADVTGDTSRVVGYAGMLLR
jgi:AmmeMemoRadiSam system radical SAM enzyme/AmmeMemoRadiSam system protein B/AmmeMemoRadiSam system protein A